MKIAISVDTNAGLDSQVAHHFGRCPYFALVDIADNAVEKIEVVTNPFYANHQPGQVPGFIHSLNAQVMLSGGMGRRAIEFFSELGIQACTGAGGTVRQTIEQYLDGNLAGAAPCRESEEHHGHGHHHD